MPSKMGRHTEVDRVGEPQGHGRHERKLPANHTPHLLRANRLDRIHHPKRQTAACLSHAIPYPITPPNRTFSAPISLTTASTTSSAKRHRFSTLPP